MTVRPWSPTVARKAILGPFDASEPVMHGEVLSSFPVPTFSRHECLEFQRFAGMKQGSIDMCRFRFELFAMT